MQSLVRLVTAIVLGIGLIAGAAGATAAQEQSEITVHGNVSTMIVVTFAHLDFDSEAVATFTFEHADREFVKETGQVQTVYASCAGEKLDPIAFGVDGVKCFSYENGEMVGNVYLARNGATIHMVILAGESFDSTDALAKSPGFARYLADIFDDGKATPLPGFVDATDYF